MVRLLERGDELGLLVTAVEDARAGSGRFVLVGGEAGIGKTSLVRAARASLPNDVTFVSGACEPLSVPVPLAPLRELLHASGVGDGGAAMSDDRVALARLVLTTLTSRAPAVAVIENGDTDGGAGGGAGRSCGRRRDPPGPGHQRRARAWPPRRSRGA